MNADFESLLAAIEPAAPSPRLRARLRQEIERPQSPSSIQSFLRSLLPVATACALGVLAVAASIEQGRWKDSDASDLVWFAEIPGETQHAILYRAGELPRSVTERSTTAHLRWRDEQRGAEIFAVVTRQEIVLTDLPIQ